MWLDTKGKEGKRADLSGAVLVGVDLLGADLRQANLERVDLKGATLFRANLQQTNLHMAILQGADLMGASFMYADLSGANLQNTDLASAYFVGANTYATNFQGAKNIQDTVGLHLTQTPTEIQEKKNRIQQLEQELQQAQQEAKKGEENAEQIQKLQDTLTQVEQELVLYSNIGNAQEALKTSLTSADELIKEYSKNAKMIGRIALELMSLNLLAIILFWYHYEKFIPIFDKLNAWALTLFSFPMLIILTIAITLFRHQKKLLDEVRHYSSEKRQIELYSGLLKASQYSAKSLNDPEQSANYVHETFDKIRDRILSEQPHTNTAGSAVEQEEYSSSLEPLIKVISEMIAKGETKK